MERTISRPNICEIDLLVGLGYVPLNVAGHNDRMLTVCSSTKQETSKHWKPSHEDWLIVCCFHPFRDYFVVTKRFLGNNVDFLISVSLLGKPQPIHISSCDLGHWIDCQMASRVWSNHDSKINGVDGIGLVLLICVPLIYAQFMFQKQLEFTFVYL